MPNSWGKFRKVRGMSGATASFDPRPRLLKVIRSHFAPFRFAAQKLADMASSTPRAAENWLSGQCAPGVPQLIELMASCDEIEREVMQLVEERRKAREEECPGSKSGSDVSSG